MTAAPEPGSPRSTRTPALNRGPRRKSLPCHAPAEFRMALPFQSPKLKRPVTSQQKILNLHTFNNFAIPTAAKQAEKPNPAYYNASRKSSGGEYGPADNKRWARPTWRTIPACRVAIRRDMCFRASPRNLRRRQISQSVTANKYKNPTKTSRFVKEPDTRPSRNIISGH